MSKPGSHRGDEERREPRIGGGGRVARRRRGSPPRALERVGGWNLIPRFSGGDAGPPRILLVDSHRQAREKIRRLMEREGLQVVGEAGSRREALELFAALAPDVVVLDLASPCSTCLDASCEFVRRSPGMRVIFLTFDDTDYMIAKALRLGIKGYVVKTRVVEELLQAVWEVLHGRIYVSPAISRSAS
jgi:DNA-binding NarL/FixJ family response regulator